ncbi:GntR family transcriptional regulator [Phaeobacter inhibens]|uniref:GntR family transcriptional regulator n=1 Tax=Phaeobacter inhibens TaxID=221822 RepID=UPI0021A36C21|nr:GntR family transcriptional regulator [Phaeobacter inhibens]UWS06621.1 GntR family transcriptional regulator [Phaeobacter inhibens]
MNSNQTTLRKIDKAPQTLRDIVQERMREAIIDGHFAPGERLVERPLCDQLGVSRTVVRETIRYLEAEGLVEIIPNRGPVVARLSWDQAQQIYDVRRQLEGSAAAVCATAQGPEFDAALGRALAAVKVTMNDTEWGSLLRATTDFYQLIFLEAGHSIAWDIVQRLNGRISRLRALTIAAKDRETSGMSHMTAIHDAILSRDPDKAREAVEAHIADAAQTAQRFLKDPAPVAGEARDG